MNAIEDFLKKKQGDNNKPVEYWINLLESMLNDSDFDWAQDTLEGIYDHVEFYREISEKQIMAIENIYNGRNNNYYANRRKRNR